MEQQIRNENFREIELKNLMFNVKMFSLMKKQLFSLVMMLALVVLAGTSAWAQQDGLTVATAYWHLPGSSHGVQVADHGGTVSYAWDITASSCAGANSGAAVGASITTGAYQAVITYTSAATGVYRITCTETANGCSTVRQFYTAIMNIDVAVIASESDGTAVGSLTTCNDYNSIMSTDLVGNTDAEDNTNSLNTWQDAVAAPLFQNTRYVNATLTVANLSGCPTPPGLAASDFNWQFNYTISGTNYDAGDNFVSMLPVANVTFGDAADVTNTITVAAGTTSITIPLRSFIRWGLTATDEDQEFVFDIDDASLVLDGPDADATFDDGTETVANAANNNSATQHIDASPATPRITIND